MKPGRLISPPGTYFVTFSTWHRRRLFVVENYARLFLQTLYRYRREGRFQLHAFVVMPEHVHLLITPARDVTLEHAIQLIKGGYSHALGSIIGREREICNEDSPITGFAITETSSTTKTIFTKIPSRGGLSRILANTDIVPPSRDSNSTSSPQRLKPKFQRALDRHELNSCPSRFSSESVVFSSRINTSSPLAESATCPPARTQT